MIALSRLTGWSLAEVEGMNWDDLLEDLDEAQRQARDEAEAQARMFQ